MRAPLLVVVLSPNLARWPGNRDTLLAMSEIELKFGVPPARAGAIDTALRRAQARRLAIESRYFDTPDRRLAAAGLVVAPATQLRDLGADAQGARRRPRRAPRGNRSPAGPLGHRRTADRSVAARRHGGGQAAARGHGRRRRGAGRARAGAHLHGHAPQHRDRRPRRPGRGGLRPRRDPCRHRPGAGVRGRVRAQGRRRRRAGRLRQGRRSRARAVAEHAVESGPRRPPGARRNRGPAGEGQAARARIAA